MKVNLYADIRKTDLPNFPDGVGFLSNDRSQLLLTPPNDFYITLDLYKTEEMSQYVDVQKDESVFTIERQEFNPFYIEFDFFNTILKLKDETETLPTMSVAISKAAKFSIDINS